MSRHGVQLATLVGILLVALNIRTAVSSLSPIAQQIGADIPLDNVGLALIGMVPPLAFAVSGIPVALTAKKLGLERLLLISIAAMAAGLAWRAAANGYWSLFAANTLALIGAGVCNILLPPLVKRYFPRHVGIMTALYATMMSISVALPAGFSVPITDEAGWRVSLALWAVMATVAAMPWVIVLWANPDVKKVPVAVSQDNLLTVPSSRFFGNAWRSPMVWALTGVFSLTAFHSYALLAWLPQMLMQTAGVSQVGAGGLFALFSMVGVPSALLVPILATRMKNAGMLIQIGAGSFVLGYLGLLLAPTPLTAVWVLLIGAGVMIFPACLTLFNLRSRTENGAVTLSGFVQMVGYTVGALGPLLVGGLYDLTSHWQAALALLIAVAVACFVLSFPLRKVAFIEDEVHGY